MDVKQPTNTGITNPMFWGCWAAYQSVTLQGANATGTAAGGVCAMNCTNSQGVFSFHPGGAYFGFCDGSVRFLSENIPVTLLIALATRDAGDSIDENY
jgi:prepilin-type processing-associated H-X9-DG protein